MKEENIDRSNNDKDDDDNNNDKYVYHSPSKSPRFSRGTSRHAYACSTVSGPSGAFSAMAPPLLPPTKRKKAQKTTATATATATRAIY